MQKTVVNRELHMKCDICGTEEIIKEKPKELMDSFIRGWSRMGWERPAFIVGTTYNEYNLCPRCTRKFKKLMSQVELDEKEG